MHVDDAPIESPCDEDVDLMRSGPGGLDRFCDRCNKSVYDLSAMGPERARAFLAADRGSSCIAYVADRDGELVFDSPELPTPPKASFVPLARLAQAATLAASLTACAVHGEAPPEPQVLDLPIAEPCSEPRYDYRMVGTAVEVEDPPEPEPEVQPKPKPRKRVLADGHRKFAGAPPPNYNPYAP